MKEPLLQQLDQLSTERWARRGVRTLLRAAWLSLCVWCVGLGGHLLWGWPLRPDLLGVVSLIVIGLAVGSLLRRRLTPQAAARRLDRRFHLDEQLATAVEVAAANPQPGSVAARLVAESGHTAALLHRRLSRRQQLPWQDLLTFLALALVALGLWIISGIGLPNLAAGTLPLPPLAAAADPAEQLPQEPQQQDGQQPVDGQGDQPGQPQGASASDPADAGDPQILQALADALRDQGATRPAAEALDRGDTAGAARELRELADQAGQLSQATREDLSDRLRGAARQIGGRDQDLADQLRRSASGLPQGGQSAARALDDLARAIEGLQSGQPPDQASQPGQGDQQAGDGQGQGQDQGQGSGAGAGAGSGSGGGQRQAGPSDRLGVEGQPVPLDTAGAGDLPAQPSGRPPTVPGSQPGFAQGGAASGRRVDVGADPLRVPLDERDVVQEYFQP